MKYSIADLGIVCALGAGAEAVLERMLAGDTSGMKRLTGLTAGDETVFGFAPGWGPERPPELAEGETRVGALVDRAMAQLDLETLFREVSAERIGAVIGTSNSTMEEFTDHPDQINMAFPAEHIRDKWGVKGPVWSVSTACSSSAKVFASARRLLELDVCDAVIVGGVDAYTRVVVEGFHALEALSPKLCRPCSPNRDGINLGEGAALFVLRRGEPSGRVRLLGVGESSDAHHLTAPDPEGRGAEASMRAALADAGLSPRDIGFINLHGTGTVYNDSMELAAVERVFGKAVCRISTKPFTGHCLGAAGAVEAALCCLRLLALPSSPVPSCCLSNSFAFGGSNASVILARDI